MVSIGRGFGAGARSMLLEVMAIAERIGSKPAEQSALEVCAGLAAADADWQRAARYFGVAEAEAAQTGLQRDPADAAFLLPLIARAKDGLGATDYAAAEDLGRALSPDEALRQARSWLEGRA
jgi:hypothetical protein